MAGNKPAKHTEAELQTAPITRYDEGLLDGLVRDIAGQATRLDELAKLQIPS